MHISKSSLLGKGDCAYSWYCSHILNLPGKSSIGLIFGGSFHKAMEDFYKAKMKSKILELDECQSLYEKAFNERVEKDLRSKLLEFEKGDDVEAIEKGKLLVAKYLPFTADYDPVAVEKQFELSVPGVDWTIFGYIDLIAKRISANGRVVVDLKTGSSSPYKIDDKKADETEEKRINWLNEILWSPEVACYVLAHRVVFGVTEDAFEYHHMIKTKEPKILVTPVKVGDTQIDFFMKMAVDAVKSIQMGIFERNTSSNWCSPKGCAYWDVCHGISPEPVTKSMIKIV